METMTRTAPHHVTARFAMSVKMACKAGETTQAEISMALGITRDAIAKKLAGKVRFNLDEVLIIAHVFGVDPGAMIGGAGSWLNEIDPGHVRQQLGKAAGGNLIAEMRYCPPPAWPNSRTAIAGLVG